jgi:hypothetical protein
MTASNLPHAGQFAGCGFVLCVVDMSITQTEGHVKAIELLNSIPERF